LTEVVFVEGCTTGLFFKGQAVAEVRPTFDVDVTAEITTYADYATFSERLRALGFRGNTSKNTPLYRWLIDNMILDVVSIEEKILGLTNRRNGLATICQTNPTNLATKMIVCSL
jgi:hypothetical protein